jgi:hypothetical protein
MRFLVAAGVAASVAMSVIVGSQPARAATGVTVAPGHLLATLSGASAGDDFGNAVAVSSTTAVIGAAGAGSNAGAAYLYTRTSLGWNTTPTAVLHGVTAGDEFGVSVAISGATVAIGAPGRNSSTGAVYLYTQTASGWATTPTVVFTGPETFASFGQSVAISGSTVLAGTIGHGAYVFTKTSNGWKTAPTALFPGIGSGFAGFGWSVALNGNFAAVGAPCAKSCQGAAYIFTKSSAGWDTTPTTTLADHSTYSQFGVSLAMDATTLVVGAIFHNDNDGAAYVYTRGAAGWTTTPTLAVYGTAGSQFGASVTVLGSRVGVGAINGFTNGAAYEFVKSQSGWDSTPRLALHAFASGDEFGSSTAMSTGAMFVGAPNANSGFGAVYIFSS